MRIRAPALPWDSLGPHPTYSDWSPFIRLLPPHAGVMPSIGDAEEKEVTQRGGKGQGVRGAPHSPFPPITWRWGYFCLM